MKKEPKSTRTVALHPPCLFNSPFQGQYIQNNTEDLEKFISRLSEEEMKLLKKINQVFDARKERQMKESQTEVLSNNDFQAEIIKRVVASILNQFPKYSFASAITALNYYYYPRYKTRPPNTSTKIEHSSTQPPKIFKEVSQASDYCYILSQNLPEIWTESIPAYDPGSSPFFDMVAYNISERTQSDELKLQEQRFAAQIFCSKGYGISFYRQEIRDPHYNLSKDKYKSLMGSTVRLAFRQIQQFLQLKMKRDTSALRRVQVKAMLTPILNVRSEFSQKHRETFYRCIKTTFRIETELALDKDVLQFYRAAVDKIRGQQYVRIVDRELTPEEQQKIDSKVYENTTLWTPQLEKQFAEIYLKRQCLSGIKTELQEKYPSVDPQHFQQSRLRARGDRIFAVATRKANIILDRMDKKAQMIVLTDRLKKIISRSPVAASIRVDLCHIFLSQNIGLNFVVNVLRNIKIMGQQMQSSFYESNQAESKTKFEVQQQNQVQKGNTVKLEQGWPPQRSRGRKRRPFNYTYTDKSKQLKQQEHSSSTESLRPEEKYPKVKIEPQSIPKHPQINKLSLIKEEQHDIFYSSDQQDLKTNELSEINRLIAQTSKELQV